MSDLPAVPDYFGQFMAPLQRQQQIGIAQQNADAQTMQVRAQVLEEQRKELQAALFQRDAAAVIANPTPEGYRQLMLQHPEMHEGLKAAWDQYSEGNKESDISAASQVYAALANGRSDLALSLLKDRKTAQANSGADDKITDQLIEMVESGDPQKIKQAQGIAGFVLANATGPDKIGATLNALGQIGPDGKGQVVGRAIGHYENGEFKVDYRDPDAPQYRELDVTGPDGQTHKAIVRVGGDGQAMQEGGGQGGFSSAVATVLKNEGGYAPKDMNGKPVNFGINQGANPDLKVKDLTRDQAIQIYHDRYWVPSGAENLPANLQTPYFDVYIRNPKFAKKALADSGGDPQRFMQISSNYFQRLASKPGNERYRQPYANRDANNMAIAGGGGNGTGADVVAMGAPGGSAAQYKVLSDAEAVSRGLPSGIKYQVNTSNGQITALGGQNRQAKQIPQQVQNKVQPMVDVRDTINRLNGSFKDDYGGHYILGDNLNAIQGQFDSVGPKGMRDWWADFKSMDNVVRNQLFGSALTEHEKRAYEATTISPKMDPAEIRKNLTRRRAIVNAATARQQNFLKKNGYDGEAVDALFQPLGPLDQSSNDGGWKTLPSGLRVRRIN